MTQDIPVYKTDYGISSNYGDFIEINRKLDFYPNLKHKIMQHELRHTSGMYGVTDLLNDFSSKDSTFKDTLLFCAKNPEAIINFFPFMYSYFANQWAFNSSSIPPFLVLGIIFVAFFKFAVGLPFLHLIIGWISVVGILNLILIIYTHFYVKKAEKLNRKQPNFKVY